MNDSQSISSRRTAIEKPEIVIAAATRPSDLAVLLRLLQAAGLSDREQELSVSDLPQLISQDHIGPVAALSDWLLDHPEAHLVMLVPLPDLAVARRLNAGMPPGPALAEWLETAKAVLHVVRPNRRRVSLVLSEPALAAPEALLASLSQRLQLQLNEFKADEQIQEMPGAVVRMMAESAFRQSTEARDLASELMATALPLPVAKAFHPLQITSVFDEYRKGMDDSIKAAADLQEQNEQLLAQLHRVQEELEAQLSKLREKERQLTATGQQVVRLRSELQSLRDQPAEDLDMEDLQDQNNLLQLQLHQVQEQLEHYYLQSLELASPENVEAIKLDAAQDAIRAIYHSYSWRLSRPLRWIQFVFGGARRPAVDKAPLPDDLEEAEQMIRALYSSRSWKITRPLRAVADLMTGGRKKIQAADRASIASDESRV